MWTVLTTSDFDEWFEGTPERVRVEVAAKIGFLRTLGPALKRPHADTLTGSKHANMKELRIRTPGAEVRIAFAFDPARMAILFCAGNKVGVNQRRFYKQLIELADDLFDAHLENLRKHGGA